MADKVIAFRQSFIPELVARCRFDAEQPVRANAYQFTADQAAWELTELGRSIGFGVDGVALACPNDRPDDVSGFLIGSDVNGAKYPADIILGWFGEAFNSVGIGSATLFVSDEDRIAVRSYLNINPRELRVVGSGTGVPAGTVVNVYVRLG